MAIARALANHPDLVLLDEPTGDLDLTAGDAIMALLSDLNRDEGVTLVLVTHNPRVANMAHRHISMVDGRIVDRGKSPLPATGDE